MQYHNYEENINVNYEYTQRRADVLLHDIVMNKMDFIDVTLCSVRCPESSTTLGSTVARGESRKMHHYNRYCEFPDTARLIPFALDTYGGWGKKFLKFLKAECAQAHCGNTESKGYSKKLWDAKCKIQFAHTRALGNSFRTLLNICLPPPPPMDLHDSSRITTHSQNSDVEDSILYSVFEDTVCSTTEEDMRLDADETGS